MTTTLIGGLDLGLVADYSALSVLERAPAPEPTRKRRWRYTLRWLETWELGTRYVATREGERSIIGDVAARFADEPLKNSLLAVDFTGVGTAVVDSMRAAKVKARLNPVLITSGHQIGRPETNKERAWHVPKKELVTTLTTLLQAGLMTWPRPDPRAKTPFARALARFEKEMADFRIKITKSANETFGGDKSQHDDLVLSVMLAAWLGEHTGTGDPSGIVVPEGAEANFVGGSPDGVFPTGKGV